MDYATQRPNASLKEPFVGGSNDDMESLSTRLTDNIEAIVDAVQSLEEYEMRLGSQDDSKRMRTRMKDQLAMTNDLIKKTSEVLRQFEGLKLKRKDEIDYRNKILKRTKDNFIRQSEKFHKINKDIQTKEKVYIDHVQEPHAKRPQTISMAQTEADNDIRAHASELDYVEALQKERENDVQDIRRLAHEINLTAQYQARKLQENSEEIVLIQDNFQTTENFTEMGKKELDEALINQKKMTKRNIIILAVILVICIIVFAIILSSIHW